MVERETGKRQVRDTGFAPTIIIIIIIIIIILIIIVISILYHVLLVLRILKRLQLLSTPPLFLSLVVTKIISF
jgi:hypothetical protein